MPTRDDVLDKIVKVLRLAHAAGSESEAHTALLVAQRMMFAHGVRDDELHERRDDALADEVVDVTAGQVGWREYLAAVVAENFRCAFIISRARGGGAVRLVFVGRRGDAAVAREAYGAAAAAAQGLVDTFALTRGGADPRAARASFLTGFIAGLYARFQENVQDFSLAVATDAAVLEHARGLTNAADATGAGLPQRDAEAVGQGFESGYAHGVHGGRKLPG
jgi:hypothetical protein